MKVGGAEGVDLDAVSADVAALWAEGRPVVLVHGGSAETNRVAEALGHPPVLEFEQPQIGLSRGLDLLLVARRRAGARGPTDQAQRQARGNS